MQVVSPICESVVSSGHKTFNIYCTAATAYNLLLHARLDPAPEDVHSLVGPGPVAGHRPVVQALQDAIGVYSHILVRPQIEGPFHRLSVHWAEQWLDVLGEAYRLTVCGQSDHLFLLGPGSVRRNP
jgi:hypothetical protein